MVAATGKEIAWGRRSKQQPPVFLCYLLLLQPLPSPWGKTAAEAEGSIGGLVAAACFSLPSMVADGCLSYILLASFWLVSARREKQLQKSTILLFVSIVQPLLPRCHHHWDKQLQKHKAE